MKGIIIYGSRYGSTEKYASELSSRADIPAVNYKSSPRLTGFDTIVYIGALYAGGIMGLRKTLGGLTPDSGRRLIIVTVGLADPQIPENRVNILSSLRSQLPPELFQTAQIFHLRGGIDYGRLSLGHRTAMALLNKSINLRPRKSWSAEDQAIQDTYGKKVDFVDFNTLIPIIDVLGSR